jgi:peptidoglycan hydrolase-like protein with peptidoglycan-binding domain
VYTQTWLKNCWTTYFGEKTKQAVIKLQNAYKDAILTPAGLSQGTGYFGPSTIKYVNSTL